MRFALAELSPVLQQRMGSITSRFELSTIPMMPPHASMVPRLNDANPSHSLQTLPKKAGSHG
jgi:hypothetical protein